MLRYHHFAALPGWTRGYGSSDDEREFRVLHGYSPYRQVVEAGAGDPCAPPTLVTVGEKDEVAPPLHGYKYVAALQHRRAGGAGAQCANPALLKIVRGAGHTFGTTPEQTRRTYAEELTFLAQVLNLGPVDASAR
jgi:prolyl oligopeptidase